MQYNSLGNFYEGIRLANNVFEKRLTPEVWALFETLASLKGIKTEAIEILQQEIVKRLSA